jgi:hypothetical protein
MTSWKRSKVFSDWLPSYIKATRPVLEIFKMAAYFLDRPRMFKKKCGRFECRVLQLILGFYSPQLKTVQNVISCGTNICIIPNMSVEQSSASEIEDDRTWMFSTPSSVQELLLYTLSHNVHQIWKLHKFWSEEQGSHDPLVIMSPYHFKFMASENNGTRNSSCTHYTNAGGAILEGKSLTISSGMYCVLFDWSENFLKTPYSSNKSWCCYMLS